MEYSVNICSCSELLENVIFAERARPRPQEDVTPEPEHGEDGELNVEDTITQEHEDDDHDDGDDGDYSEDVSDSDEEEDSLATTSQSDQADTVSSSGNNFQVDA